MLAAKIVVLYGTPVNGVWGSSAHKLGSHRGVHVMLPGPSELLVSPGW
jgi:hypothetical protein